MKISAGKEKKMIDSKLYQVFLCSCLCSDQVSPVQEGISSVAVVTHTQKTSQCRGDSQLKLQMPYPWPVSGK